MKYLVLLGDGMADYPLDALGGKTPLEVASTPNMDEIALKGTLGLIDTVPAGFLPGSDVANLSVLGYDPEIYFTGRGPLEAANMGVQLGPDDVAFRCNLVTLNAGNTVMDDYSAGHITTEDAIPFVHLLNEAIGSEQFIFYPGISYRHLMVWKGGYDVMQTTPPHDIVDQPIMSYFPEGEGSDEIKGLMTRSMAVLKTCRENQERVARGMKPVSSIWLWGQGRAPRMTPITKKFSIRGGIISAVNLLNGIGHYAGLEILSVPGATGYIDTNYVGKAEKALEALQTMDFVFVHVEAPDEMGHEGNLAGKIRAIELFDEKVVGTVLKAFPSLGDARLAVLSDHPTPITLKTHVSDPSPFAVLSNDPAENLRNAAQYSERNAEGTGLVFSPGHLMLEAFINNWRRAIAKEHH